MRYDDLDHSGVQCQALPDIKQCLDDYFTVETMTSDLSDDHESIIVNVKFGVQPIANFRQLLEPIFKYIIYWNASRETRFKPEYFTFSYEPYKLKLIIKRI